MTQQKTFYLAVFFTIGICAFQSCSKDDDCTQQTWYHDADGDGFGNPDDSQKLCTQPENYVLDNTDFDDLNNTAYPGAVEICDDNIDNNGNGDIDECSIIDKIVGDWTNNFGDSYIITDTSIVESTKNYTFQILASGDNFVLCFNDANNPYFAGLYTKFVFTYISENEFYVCQSFYDSPSIDYIENHTDPSVLDDLDSGCGGFAWSKMTKD